MAFSLQDKPLKHQLVWLITATGVCALICASVIFFLLLRHTILSNFAHTQATITKVAAKKATQTMLNQDADTAQKILNPLSYNPDINLACLYGFKNAVIAAASFPNDQSSARKCPDPTNQSSQIDQGAQLHSFEKIKVNDTIIGTLYTRANQTRIQSDIITAGTLTVVAFVASTLLLLGLALRLQRTVTQPISALCNTLKNTVDDHSNKIEINTVRQDEIGQLARLFQSILSVTEHQESELATMTYKDMVTALPNRRMLMQYLEKAIHKLQRSGEPLAILMIHINGLATINQQLSHEMGDAALMAAAERLQSCARSEDIIARLGGNTFIALILSAPEVWRIRSAAERVIKAIEEPIHIQDETLTLTANIGIAVSPQDGQNPDSLLKIAELATQSARQNKGAFCFFNEQMQDDTLASADSAAELQTLLNAKKIQLYINPIFQLGTLSIRGIELALFTKDDAHPAKSCTALLAQCENKDVLQALNEWLPEELSRCLQSLEGNALSKLESVTWQVNLKQIFCGNFVPSVIKLANTVNDYGMALLLAVSEKDIQQLTDSQLHLNEELKPLDVGLVVNTCGSGTTTLGRLPNLPIRQIRFDCQHVNKRSQDLTHADVHDYLNQVIIELSNLIDLACVARNVTIKSQAEQFNQMGCEYGQGDYFADIVPIGALTQLLEQTMPFGAENSAANL